MFSTKSSGSAATPEPPRSKSETAMVSVISKELIVHGDLTSEGDIQIDGTVEGDVKTAKVTIGEGGSVHGTITGDSVMIAGAATGKIRSRTVALVRSARVQAELWVESLAIEAGARFEGSCKRFGADGEAAEAAPSTPVRLAVAGGRTGEPRAGED